MSDLLKFLAILPIRFYKLVISPWLGANCRFQPSCSDYGKEAIERYGVFRGGILTVNRLLRCHPIKFLGGGSGYDPVPECLCDREKKKEKTDD